MRSLVQLYIDNTLPDNMNFGLVRSKAFLILSREELVSTLSSTNKPKEEVEFYWQAIDNFKRPIKSNLRYLVESLDFSSTNEENSWLEAIKWIKTEFFHSNRPSPEVSHCPNKTIPVKLQQYLTTNNGDKEAQINPHHYEYSIYRRLNEYLKTGKIYLEDSLQHRSLTQELVFLEEKDELIKQLNIPALNRPITEQLDDLFIELGQLWESFNKKLHKRELKHLRYDKKNQTLHLQKIKVDKDEQIKHHFFKQLPFCDIVDVLKFVNKDSGFLADLTHIQPRYAKQIAREDCLIATVIAQAMNNGNLNMSNISNIPYVALQDTLQSHIRLSTLKAANDIISNGISRSYVYFSILFIRS